MLEIRVSYRNLHEKCTRCLVDFGNFLLLGAFCRLTDYDFSTQQFSRVLDKTKAE